MREIWLQLAPCAALRAAGTALLQPQPLQCSLCAVLTKRSKLCHGTPCPDGHSSSQHCPKGGTAFLCPWEICSTGSAQNPTNNQLLRYQTQTTLWWHTSRPCLKHKVLGDAVPDATQLGRVPPQQKGRGTEGVCCGCGGQLRVFPAKTSNELPLEALP